MPWGTAIETPFWQAYSGVHEAHPGLNTAWMGQGMTPKPETPAPGRTFRPARRCLTEWKGPIWVHSAALGTWGVCGMMAAQMPKHCLWCALKVCEDAPLV